ncbi:hypothetical protein ALC62_13942 [Cyphomyrmex costatus]|uniref:Uncharacterized protein n=1 Tax=Cyphomyrmex costatus TaxID=456900 RepID=A0A195C3S9_9HYME|nr:hypothetical protein ALC62_13942 [Cyphomyrmex costatus]
MFEVADKAGGFGAGATLCREYSGNCLADAILLIVALYELSLVSPKTGLSISLRLSTLSFSSSIS